MPSLDYIQHYNAVRVRVKGVGNLDLTLYSLDSIYSQELVPIAMAALNSRPVTRLANFSQARAQLLIKTDAINEVFEINQITVYVSPIYAAYPG